MKQNKKFLLKKKKDKIIYKFEITVCEGYTLPQLQQKKESNRSVDSYCVQGLFLAIKKNKKVGSFVCEDLPYR